MISNRKLTESDAPEERQSNGEDYSAGNSPLAIREVLRYPLFYGSDPSFETSLPWPAVTQAKRAERKENNRNRVVYASREYEKEAVTSDDKNVSWRAYHHNTLCPPPASSCVIHRRAARRLSSEEVYLGSHDRR